MIILKMRRAATTVVYCSTAIMKQYKGLGGKVAGPEPLISFQLTEIEILPKTHSNEIIK